ncbi:hypothetical protein Ait01nite_031740 [Actinoplanes italicus]|uniref:Uncharacterized protein n=1 Tax=Actinoplanes italicus TaxID=113567 RepID=A0A2T0KJB9_9ACTN|nr:hypothetical protein [Actinoplanes italicus]PRX23629.1 hypothetical protein CLV67_103378 [Actinoplanes italicus]GIE30129.1 hypothetical protein Ait01nite_031740 [Actinoplanes italicus]
MTIAEILASLLAFAVASAALGMVYGLARGANPIRAAVSGLIAYAVLSGLLALPVTFVVAVLEVRS